VQDVVDAEFPDYNPQFRHEKIAYGITVRITNSSIISNTGEEQSLFREAEVVDVGVYGGSHVERAFVHGRRTPLFSFF
jgi:hypothetical protein